MTAKELIQLLETFDPDAVCWVESQGEHLRVSADDIQFMEKNDGSYLNDAEEGEEHENTTGLVVFSTWA